MTGGINHMNENKVRICITGFIIIYDILNDNLCDQGIYAIF